MTRRNTVIMWAATYADGSINPNYVFRTRGDVILHFCEGNPSAWPGYRKHGYRVIKVVVAPLGLPVQP